MSRLTDRMQEQQRVLEAVIVSDGYEGADYDAAYAAYVEAYGQREHAMSVYASTTAGEHVFTRLRENATSEEDQRRFARYLREGAELRARHQAYAGLLRNAELPAGADRPRLSQVNGGGILTGCPGEFEGFVTSGSDGWVAIDGRGRALGKTFGIRKAAVAALYWVPEPDEFDRAVPNRRH